MLVFPNGGETIDDSVSIQWHAAVDNETAQGNLTYDLDYSGDGGVSWTNLTQTGPGSVSWPWNTTSLPEGEGYRVRVRAFDGSDYGPFDWSGNNFSIRHFSVVFSGAAQAGFAEAGAPVEWVVEASGFGSGVCNYSSLPFDTVGLRVLDGWGADVVFDSGGAWVAWSCNLSASNYSLHFFTPALAVVVGSGIVEGGYWVRNVSVAGDAARGVENVSFSASLPGYVLGGTEFARVLNSSGEWVDATPFLGDIGCDGPAPGFSSFYVDGAVWRVCKKDSDGDGVFDYFRFVAPLVGAGGSALVQVGAVVTSPPGGGGPGGSGTATPSPSASVSPPPSPTPSVSPFPSPEANETIVESVEELNGTTAILGPSEAAPGLVVLGFLAGSGVANGSVELFDPAGRRFVREIGLDGSLGFYFDKEGKWVVRFGNETKEIMVRKTRVPASEKIALGDDGGEAAAGGSGTGLVVGGLEPLWYGLLFLAAVGAVFVLRFLGNRVRVVKSFSNGSVRLEVAAGKALKDLVLVDVVPEELEVGDFTEGMSRRDTVTGAALKWKKKELKKGEKWVVGYVLKNAEGAGAAGVSKLRRAELKAVDEKGGKISVFSNEVAL
ncbi:MAG: fibronectin type III domain-containing protein [Candidatus Micrarchaeota archaeon]|nr:fibronectin type III domain-containing protein [Candidatus Micrarchaeota archaeon]